MFVIRGKNGEIVVSTELNETLNQEIRYETRAAAEQDLRKMEQSLPEGLFHIEELTEEKLCERCNSGYDVTEIYVNNKPKTYCQACRAELFSKKNPVGRPREGVTQKVSLTLSESEWEMFDQTAEGNRAGLLREFVRDALWSEGQWSNNACLGYVVSAAEKLGYDVEQIKQLARAVSGEFDLKTLDQAKKIYNKSNY